ncbi:SusC/RagA family TonB-linked outer membrane protein [Arcticibacter tournemirensis]
MEFFLRQKSFFRHLCCLMLLFPLGVVWAQTVTVNGTVKDDKQEPLPGVTITVKGTKKITLTDNSGRFTLQTPGSSVTLVFSYLGYAPKEVTTGAAKNLQVVMKTSSSNLEEVIVVGYGTQKRASLLGSVSSVQAAEITKAPIANISQALVGKLPGLITNQSSGLPGSDQVDLYVRGFSSLNKNTPLVLVDGVERSFNNLDPSEIESVTILKDAASAAVYGVRGATGVILVTTKRGKDSKPTFSYTSSYTLSSNTRMPEYLDGQEFVQWYNYADEINGRSHTFPDEVVNKVANGDPNGIFGNTNWTNEILKSTAPSTQHNISLRGGNSGVKYFASLGYLNQQGIIKGVDYSRYNLRTNVDASVTKDFSISLDVAGNVSNANSPQISNFTGNGNTVSTNLMNQIIIAHPYINPKTPDGKYLSSSLLSGNNPMAARDLSGYNDNDNTQVQSSLTLKYTAPFLEGLSFRVVGSYDKNYYHTKSFYTPYTLQTIDPTNPTGTLSETASPYGTVTMLSEGYAPSSRWTVQQFINFKRTFNEKHAVDALIVGEQSGYKYTELNAFAQNFDLTDLDQFGFAKDNPRKPTGEEITTNRIGWVGRLNYTYDNRYLAEFSGRVDASTNFSENNRYGFFPSVSAGWRISEESFFKNLKTPVTNLKLSASYGILGNDVTRNTYEYLRFMNVTSDPVANIGGGNVNGMLPTSYPNTDLTWEKTKTSNIGLELEMWNGLLSAEFNGFYKVTSDILTTVSNTYPPSIGGYYPTTVNSGKVDNRGLEVVLGHRNKISDFSYSISGSVGWARNKILSMDQAADLPEYQSLVGRSIGSKTGLIALGLFQTDAEALASPVVSTSARAGDIRFKDINGDGKISYEQDVTVIGRSNIPELTYSFNYNSAWKNFELSFLLQGAAICDNALMGYYEEIGWDDTQFTRTFYNGGNSPQYLIEGAWSPTNTSGKYPRLDNQWRSNNNWASTMWIENGAYLRLKNLQLAYKLPKSLKGKSPAFDMKIYVAAMNLLTFSSFKYLDPEAPNVSNGYYPQQKTYSLGVSMTF